MTFPVPEGDVEAGNWVHLAGTITIEGDQYTMRLYRNGELAAEGGPFERSAEGNAGLLPMNVGWGIGARAGISANERVYNGLIDDVRLYSRALSAGEIAELLTAEPPPARPSFGNVGFNATTGEVTINWTGEGVLHRSETLSPPDWQPVAGATSPYVINAEGGSGFFQVIGP